MKWALTLLVMTAFGSFCYSAGYNSGRTEESAQIERTSQAVTDALNRLAAMNHEERS